MNKLKLTLAGIALIGLPHISFSQINVTRNMPSTVASGAEFTVELVVDKGATSGFAKLQDELPDGFTASAIESKSATFSFDKNKVKLIWMSLPGDAKFTVSYKVKVDAAATGTKSISGTFSYIDGNDTKKITITASSINISAGGSSATPAKTEDKPVVETKQPEKVTPPIIEKTTPKIVEKAPEPTPAPPAAEPKKVEPPVVKPVVKTPPTTPPATPKAVTGIVFRVQIGAGQNAGSEGFLKSKYNIAEEIYAEQIDGLYKYTAGSFSSFAAAKDYRDKVRSAGDDGAFIVAYQNGARISMQEALKSSGQ